jgi:hypothetical protein
MTNVYVNQVERVLAPAPETWGDLLDKLDADASRDGLLLTAARFDGVEIPAFRDPDMTARRLQTVGRVDVDTAPPRTLLRQCLVEAIPSLGTAATEAEGLAAIYRGEHVAPGHERLAALALELGALTSLIAALEGPLEIDVRAIVVDGVSGGQHLQTLISGLDALVDAQQSQDWLTVADVLEYDVAPAIAGWSALFSTLAGHATLT